MNDPERNWWCFQMPECIAWAPGETEDDARNVLAKNHCPELRSRAFFYPVLASRHTTRARLWL